MGIFIDQFDTALQTSITEAATLVSQAEAEAGTLPDVREGEDARGDADRVLAARLGDAPEGASLRGCGRSRGQGSSGRT